MELILNATEVRVIGALIEKQHTTPEYYPLTLNGLVTACNQLTNRDPVVVYDDKTVARAIETLREKKCAQMIISHDQRVPKYGQVMTELLDLALQEVALLAVLMLRGAQTAGELRSRSSRIYEFGSLDEVDLTLNGLIERNPPLIARLPRQAGTKESRYAHLLSGEVIVSEPVSVNIKPAPAMQTVQAENEQIAALTDQVTALRAELQSLKAEFETFKKQFE